MKYKFKNKIIKKEIKLFEKSKLHANFEN